jgi:fluoride exporter
MANAMPGWTLIDFPKWQLLLSVGFCGSFTTFSTWVLDIQKLNQDSGILAAAGHSLLSVSLGMAALAAGIYLSKVLA